MMNDHITRLVSMLGDSGTWDLSPNDRKAICFALNGLVSAKHLLLAATGPNGGPTSWSDTRETWLHHFGNVPFHAEES